MKNISSKNAGERLIFALDVQNYEDALSLVDLLSGHVGMFKIGKELFTAAGPKIIRAIKERNQKVFLDLKFHDIPNTVARAAEAAVKMHVDMFNVHASGGSRMIRESVSAAWTCSDALGRARPILLAVTVLTSLNNDDLKEIGFQKTTNELVVHLAGLAKAAGASGVVASAQDIVMLRKAFGEDFVIVTPGIRSAAEIRKDDDQKRTLSAYDAVAAGADYIVVGRPIRTAADPLKACRQIVQEIAEGLSAR
ncbi:MAG TPA: orotidine-5'-phosphate decarboxylase [Smithella sp.]|jgi:orotidine-5'-phosphate decarboxylase|nr:orotidine-5'-phosphate decarboxylase [Deltaproteobacteria bacterium]OQC53631.1 MAG: Orotidine 5'-phosphate decarboxylase [Deltaproteobacteria bacterium ADurb.Bin022]HQC18385.1 orotidine-5'-phosphate decarboxylase [Smithella sp.]HQL97341.1 orotidine-5'-phosphate decarboxylase [Smithella sp.]HQN70019.1 orotidine-5'-phosphate decarboxylase [Smithella sp.]